MISFKKIQLFYIFFLLLSSNHFCFGPTSEELSQSSEIETLLRDLIPGYVLLYLETKLETKSIAATNGSSDEERSTMLEDLGSDEERSTMLEDLGSDEGVKEYERKQERKN